jgi:hypothetical protein
MKAPPPNKSGFTIRNDHAGPLNARTCRIFEDIYSGDGAAALAELLRSDEPLDKHTRSAVAAALEAAVADRHDAIRLSFHRPSNGSRSIQKQVEAAAKRQMIADYFEKFKSLGKQRAYQEIIKMGLANSDRTIDAARKAVRESPVTVRITQRGSEPDCGG